MSAKGKIILDRETYTDESVEIRGPAIDALILWKPREGTAVTVISPGGRLYRARVVSIGEGLSELRIYEKMREVRTPPVEITLLQALPEKERMEVVIEKTTELGVDVIVPFESGKSTSLEERERGQKKSHRWGSRALSAARQCRRESIPEILPCTDFEGALKTAEGADLKIMLWEGHAARPLKEVLRDAPLGDIKSAVLLTGPEGGFTGEEVSRAYGGGFTPVSLGRRILRTETAAITAVGIVGYELGW